MQYGDGVTEPALSQRERNRIDTWHAIHEAAYTLASNVGPAATTTEGIASAAGVSRRTFFNYFPTKEDAVLGTRVPRVDDAAIEKFRASADDELTRVVHLFVSVARTALPEVSIMRRRRIVAEHPELRQRVIRLVSEVERLVTEVLQTRVGDGAFVDLSVVDDDDHLEALLMLAGTIAKYALSRHQETPAEASEPFLREAIAMFRKVVDATQ